jgi:hypothetical protein
LTSYVAHADQGDASPDAPDEPNSRIEAKDAENEADRDGLLEAVNTGCENGPQWRTLQADWRHVAEMIRSIGVVSS